MKPVTKLVVAILPIFLIIGCGTKEVKEEDSASAGENVSVDSGATQGDTTGGERLDDQTESTTDMTSSDTSSTDQSMLEERKVYFDFDRSDIRNEDKTILKAHAEYLMSNASASVVIEGNCDERGTREYNMALGERRAHSVKQFLTLQGVSQSQISTVSFGEERPDVEGHDESAWKFNRRAVIVYSE